VLRQKPQPAASLSDNSNSSATGLTSSCRTHTTVDLLTLACMNRSSRRNFSAVNFNAQSVGGSRSSTNLTQPLLILLGNKHRKVYGDLVACHTEHCSEDPCHGNSVKSDTYTKPEPRSPLHHVHQPKSVGTHDSSAPPRQHRPCAPLMSLRLSNITNQPPPPLPQSRDGLHMQRLQGGHNADGAAVTRP
jgi:hypothetical protein